MNTRPARTPGPLGLGKPGPYALLAVWIPAIGVMMLRTLRTSE